MRKEEKKDNHNIIQRRTFLKTGAALFGTGAFLLNKNNTFADKVGTYKIKDGANPKGMSFNMGTITEPARDIPIAAKADVVVVGGGPAGVAAALGAARAGANTILVERYNHLGGLWTGGLVLPLLSTRGKDKSGKPRQVIYGIGGDIMERLEKLGTRPTAPDPEAAKYVLDVMMKESGVRLLYNSWAGNVIVKDNIIEALLIETKSGRVAIKPKVVIDCTGDGDVFDWAGENFEKWNMGLSFVCRIGNANLVDVSKGAKKRGERTAWKDIKGGGRDALDFFELSKSSHEGRIRAWENVEKLKKRPGYEGIFMMETAPQVGTRASRILDGLHHVNLEESVTYKNYDDAIGISGGWTNVRFKDEIYKGANRPMWQIPYRSLVPKKTKNLLVGGRCISCTKDLFQDVRVIGTCMVSGHGAGVGAGIAVKSSVPVQNVDNGALKKELLKQNVFLG